MMKGASPLKSNQGTNARYQKNKILAKPNSSLYKPLLFRTFAALTKKIMP